MAHDVRIEQVEAGGQTYDQVVELGDANSSTLGQLPYAVFTEAAASGCLLAAMRRGEVIGYALFALRKRRHEVSLTHLCVRNDMRKSGAARRLVEEITRLHPGSSRHPASMSSGLPPPTTCGLGSGSKNGVVSAGRSRAGHMLAVWWRRIADWTLFDVLAQASEAAVDDDLILAVLDTNVVLDVRDGRDEGASHALMADWLVDHAELVITAEVSRELQASKTARRR